MPLTTVPTLSICIASMRRPVELRRQVERLLTDADGLAVEIVVADASSPAEQLDLDHPFLTVLRLDGPNGVDHDYELAIRAASGEYCWLFTDDDSAAEGTCRQLLDLINRSDVRPSLVLIDAAVLSPDVLEFDQLSIACARRSRWIE